MTKSWMWYIFPASVAVEGLHIAIPLFILSVNGTVIDVGIAIAAQYCSSALGSIFWGKIIDKYHVKRIVLLACFGMIALSSFLLYLTSDIAAVFLLSGLVGFFSIGKNPITQIMVMETNQSYNWGRVFAITSILTSFGSLSAFVVGMMWDTFFDLNPYFVFCAIFSAAAFVFSVLVGKNTFLERHTLVESFHGISFVLRHLRLHHHMYFPKFPHNSDWKHVIGVFQGKIRHEIGLLFLTNFFFYFGSNVYFTILIPFLKENHFSDSQVFAVYMCQSAVMLGFFFLVPKITGLIGDEKSLLLSYFPRICGIIITAVLIPLTLDGGSFLVALLASSIMVIAFSVFSTANSVILFRAIPKGFEGRFLGLNSFMIGIGIFAASLTGGFLTSSLGYEYSFIVSVVLIGFSSVLFLLYKKHQLSERHHPLKA